MVPHKQIQLIILLFLCVPFLGLSQRSFTLEQAIQYGIKNNGSLAIQKMDLQDVDAQIWEYKSIGLPKITGGINYTYFLDIPTNILPNFISPAVYEVLFDEKLLDRKDINTGPGVPVQFGTKNNLTAKLEFQTLLFDGSFFVGLKAQKMYKELSQLQFAQTESSLRYQLAKSYMAALSVEENIKILDKNILNIEKVYQQFSAIQKAGFAEALDVERLQLSLWTLQTEKEKLNRIANVLRNVLKFQMSYPLNDSLILADKLDNLLNSTYADIMDPSIQLQFERRPEYQTVSKALALSEINVKRLKSLYLPSLFGFASYQQTLQRNDLFNGSDNPWFPASVIGLNMNIPIFDGFDKRSKIARAKIQRDKAILQKGELEKGIDLEYQNAKIQYLNSLVSLEARKKNVVLAEKIYNTTQIKFNEGVGSSIEITQAERDVYSAQAQLLEAQVQLIQAKLDLDKAIGKI